MSQRVLGWERYLDKVRGGWVGKSLGGSVGHFEGTKRITRFRMRDLLTEGVVANDDLDIQLVWLDVLLQRGAQPTSKELMQAWVERYDYNFGEYGFCRRNHLRGIDPPVSGWYANTYYKTGMGCAIRAEIWAMIAPGDPEAAARYAQTDGCLDHEGEAVHAERMLAAMEAEAFFQDDPIALVDVGRSMVSAGCELDRSVRMAVECHREGTPWEETWRALVDEFGHPDCTYVPLNLGIIIAAFLYGGLDMERTQTLAVNAGWDVDCTCATTGALLGILRGWSGMDREWTDYIGDNLVTLARPQRVFGSLSQVSADTCAVGLDVSSLGLCVTKVLPPDRGPRPAAVPRPEKRAGLALEVVYDRLPEISRDRPARVLILAENNGREPVSGTLRLEAPEGLDVEPAAHPLVVLPGERETVALAVSVRSGATRLADTNLVRCTLGDVRRTFGLAGAAAGRLLGPFFECYDDWLDRASLPGRRILATATDTVSLPEMGEEWGNHRVDIGRTYLPEDFADPVKVRELFAGGRRVHTREDCLRVADSLGFHGPCCVYVLFEVHSPVSRPAQLFLGSTDPFVLWWNGTPVFRQAANRFWFPNNDVVDVELRPGGNQLILKLARTGEDNRLSFVFRHRPTLPGYDSAAFVTDLAWGL